MAISLQCTGCGSVYNVHGRFAGRRVRCKCGAELRVPSPVAPSRPAAPAASPIAPARPKASPTPAPSSNPGIDDLLSQEFPATSGGLVGGYDPLAAGPALSTRRPQRLTNSGKTGLWVGLALGAGALLVLLVVVLATLPGRSDQKGDHSPLAAGIPRLSQAEQSPTAESAPRELAPAELASPELAEPELTPAKPAPSPKAKGYATPKEAVLAFSTSMIFMDFHTYWDALSPQAQDAEFRTVVKRAVWYADHKKDFGDRGDYAQPLAWNYGIEPLDASEEIRRQREPERVERAIALISDRRDFFANFQRACVKEKGNEGMARLARLALESGRIKVLVEDVRIQGDRAEVSLAQETRGKRTPAGEPAKCIRIGGRWFMDIQ